jgi:hypothetical protein
MTTASAKEDAQNAEYIADLRHSLEQGISGTLAELACVRETLSELGSNSVYDVEHAEGRESALAGRFLAQADDALRAAAALVASVHRSAT